MPSNVVPIVLYINADLEKDAIIKQNKGKSGRFK